MKRPPDASLTRYWLLVGAVLALFLVTFVVFSALSVALLQDPTPWLAGGPVGAAISFGLLVADVLLPVPASVLMTANGALLGLVGGALVSFAGSIAAALFGYAIGRSAGARLLQRICSPVERERADRLVRRWGLVAVAASRPVPLLAETVAVAAGASAIGPLRTVAAAAAGSLPAAVLYAAAGASGRGAPAGLLVFVLAQAMAGGLWLAARRFGRR